MQVCESQRGARSASAGRLQRPNVVYPAVGVKVERDTGDDVLTTLASYKHVEGGNVEIVEEPRGNPAMRRRSDQSAGPSSSSGRGARMSSSASPIARVTSSSV